MKKVVIILQALCLLFFCNNQAEQNFSPLNTLSGAYTNLPKSFKKLSILDGAIALETSLLKRIYNETESDKIITKPSLNLIKNLFYQIPNTNDFGLSKNIYRNKQKVQIKKIIKKLIHNLVYLYLLEVLEKYPQKKYGGDTAKAYNKTIKNIKKEVVAITPLTKEAFLSSSREISRLALLGGLWFFKKNIQDFDYEKLLKKELKSACSILLEDSKALKEIKAELEQIESKIESIKTEKKEQNLEEKFKKIETLLTKEQINTLEETDYETVIIYFIKELIGTDKHPQIIAQTKKAKVTLSGTFYTFSNCVEIFLLNIINYFLYDKTEKKVSLKILQSKFKNAHRDLVRFYEKYEKIINGGSPEDSDQIKNAWSALTCQIPGITYNEKDICEIAANTTNIIIAINHLLGCNWFDPLTNPPEEPESFIKKYLPNLLDLFSPFQTITINNQEIKKPLEENITGKNFNNIEIKKDGFSLLLEIHKSHSKLEYPVKLKINTQMTENLYQAYPMLYFLTPINHWPSIPQSIAPSFLPFFAQPIDKKEFVCALTKELQDCSYFWINRLEKLFQKYCSKNIAKNLMEKTYQKALKTIKNEKIDERKKQDIIKKNLDSIENFLEKSLSHHAQMALSRSGLFGQSLLVEKYDLLKTIVQDYYLLDKPAIKNSAIKSIIVINQFEFPIAPQEINAVLKLIHALLKADSKDQEIRTAIRTIAKNISEGKMPVFSAAKKNSSIKQNALQLLQEIKKTSE